MCVLLLCKNDAAPLIKQSSSVLTRVFQLSEVRKLLAGVYFVRDREVKELLAIILRMSQPVYGIFLADVTLCIPVRLKCSKTKRVGVKSAQFAFGRVFLPHHTS